jgi:hypothetical protein
MRMERAPQLAVATENWGSLRSWRLQRRTEGLSGVDSCNGELRESPELAVATENWGSFRSWQLQRRTEGVFGVGSCNGELRESKELAVAAENWGSLRSWQLQKNGNKRIRLHRVDFMCDLKWQWDFYESVARIRLLKTEDTSGCNSEIVKCGNSDSAVIFCSSEWVYKVSINPIIQSKTRL